MYIRIHPPLRRLPNGRPVAVMSVVDNVLGLKLLQEKKIDMKTELKRFKEVILVRSAITFDLLVFSIHVGYTCFWQVWCCMICN